MNFSDGFPSIFYFLAPLILLGISPDSLSSGPADLARRINEQMVQLDRMELGRRGASGDMAEPRTLVREVATAMAENGDPRAIDFVRWFINFPDELVRWNVMEALRGNNDPEVLDLLKFSIERHERFRPAVEILSQYRGPDGSLVLEIMRLALERSLARPQSERDIQFREVEIILPWFKTQRDPHATEIVRTVLLARLMDEGSEVVWYDNVLIQALHVFRGVTDLPLSMIRRFLAARNWYGVQRAAANLLVGRNEEEALSLQLEAVRSDDRLVREAGHRALRFRWSPREYLDFLQSDLVSGRAEEIERRLAETTADADLSMNPRLSTEKAYAIITGALERRIVGPGFGRILYSTYPKPPLLMDRLLENQDFVRLVFGSDFYRWESVSPFRVSGGSAVANLNATFQIVYNTRDPEEIRAEVEVGLRQAISHLETRGTPVLIDVYRVSVFASQIHLSMRVSLERGSEVSVEGVPLQSGDQLASFLRAIVSDHAHFQSFESARSYAERIAQELQLSRAALMRDGDPVIYANELSSIEGIEARLRGVLRDPASTREELVCSLLDTDWRLRTEVLRPLGVETSSRSPLHCPMALKARYL